MALGGGLLVASRNRASAGIQEELGRGSKGSKGIKHLLPHPKIRVFKELLTAYSIHLITSFVNSLCWQGTSVTLCDVGYGKKLESRNLKIDGAERSCIQSAIQSDSC